MIDIRPAGPDDAAQLARLRAASLVEQGYLADAQRGALERRAADDFARLFRDRRLVAWVLCADELIIGSACATYFDRLPFPDGTLHAELSGVYVEPPYRRNGHAARLIAAVVGALRGTSVRRTFLRPAPGARSLYERLGFVDDTAGLMRLGT